LQQQTAVLKAEDELVKKNCAAVLAWEQPKAAVARADAEMRAAEFVYQTKKADRKKAELDAAAVQEQIASYNASPELTAHFKRAVKPEGAGVRRRQHQPERAAGDRQRYFARHRPTRDVVDGYWLNILRHGIYCPQCNDFRPDIAIEVLRRLAAS
jgi:hypothetical protein